MSGPRCTEAEANVLDDIDARLDPAATLRLHAHLETCAACRQRAELWDWLVPEMRDLTPEPIDALAARRMQVDIERRLAEAAPARPAHRAMSRAVPAALALLGAAAALVIWVGRPARPRPAGAVASYASLARVRGSLTVGEAPLAVSAAVPIGAPLAVPAGAEAELALPRGTTLTIEGPARLALTGAADAIAVRLDDGEVLASVAHRLPGESFAVITRDLRVAVKGTRFAVTAAASESRVRVDEGTVVVGFSDGRARPVSAGQTASSVEAIEPVEPAVDSGDEATGEIAPRPTVRAESCPAAAQSCPDTAEAVRSSMRAGETARALQILADRGRPLIDLDPRCGGHGFAACQDDLRYLHAEALNQSGRLDDAVAAYRALDRRAAPPAMRQNALIAAAHIERRRGHNQAARADYERAIGAAPRGALREEAFIGAMETANAGGDRTRAQALARRYLSEFPRGLATGTASRLARAGQEP